MADPFYESAVFEIMFMGNQNIQGLLELRPN
jgi:hypothetical protein